MNNSLPLNPPLAYLLTFRCYGTWLQGDERGAVSRRNNQYGDPILPPSPALNRYQEKLLQNAATELDANQRQVVEASLRAACTYYEWQLLAVNVRNNHAHLVVTSDCSAESTLAKLKAAATRALRDTGLADAQQKVWSRHGSTIYLWKSNDVSAAVNYTENAQD